MWVKISERLPQYGFWTMLKTGSGISPGYRSHTDAKGEHFVGNYRINDDNNNLNDVTHWLEYEVI